MQEVGTLPPKTKPGLDLDQVFKPGKAVLNVPPGSFKASKPDLTIPPKAELAKEEFFPVRMLRHYRPVGDYETAIEDEDGNPTEWRGMPEEGKAEDGWNPGLELQVKEGQLVRLRKSEAKVVIKAEIADRADPID